MATWDQFHQLITSNFQVQEDKGDVLTLVFDLKGGRSQLVILQKQGFEASDSDWATISSPVGEAASVNLTLALMKAHEYVVGGLTIDGDYLVVRHALPLANLDANEIDEPLRVVCMVADQLEAELVGGDDF
jgi:hypothetical protein